MLEALGRTPGWLWLAFAASALLLLTLDHAVSRGRRRHSRTYAVVWSGIWLAAGLTFGGLVWVGLGGGVAQEYLAAWSLELGLSVDNIFIFYVVFQAFGIPGAQQHRVLFWGVFGAVVFRGLLILFGVAAFERWTWITLVFGATLLIAAWRAWRHDPSQKRRSAITTWMARRFPVTHEVRGEEFIVRQNGARRATPLLLALVAIELTDVMFAIDSIPAALSVSRNPFVIYSSNVFAVLGLRALYLALAHTLSELRYLHYALAIVLAFAAFKLITREWLAVPPVATLAAILAAMGAAIAFSVLRQRREQTEHR